MTAGRLRLSLIRRTIGKSTIEKARTGGRGETTAREPNTSTNVSRYSASGSTHSIGTAAMSVVRYVVTASTRLDGMNASATQRNRSAALSLGPPPGSPSRLGSRPADGVATVLDAALVIRAAHATIRTASAA